MANNNIYLIETFDGFRTTREIVKEAEAHDYIEELKDIYAPDEIKVEKIDIEKTIEVEAPNGNKGTLAYAYNNIHEIVDAINNKPFADEMDRDEKIDDFYIDVKEEYRKYEDAGIIEDYINDLRTALYDYI